MEKTKIAVVGAGIAGTTCARELRKLGNEVEIFEMSAKDKSTRPRQMEGSINLLQNIPQIEPDCFMKKIELHSPNVTASVKGNLGFFYEVGGTNGIDARARKNIEKLLPIHYSTKIESKIQLQDEFQIIVAADGYRSTIAKEAGLIVSKEPKRVGVAVGFTVKGDFDPELVEVWFDNYFSYRGYSYIIPFSKHEASLVSASTGVAINRETYADRLKELAQLKKWELQGGWSDFENWYDFSSYAKDNLYVVGNAGSFTEPAFGYGLKWAIQSAKVCAKAINEKLDYDCLLRKKVLADFEFFGLLRKFFDSAEDDDYDNFVKSFTNPLVKKLAGSGTSLFKNKWMMHMIFPKIKS
ncbi:MAG: NAD(P)/FAD-dependent oxidoreductase [Candidatus Bathyarchaeia archaeon]